MEGKRLRILLFEADEVLRRDFLQSFKVDNVDVEVTECDSAEASLDFLQTDTPDYDLIVTGHDPPGLNGLEFCRKVLDKGLPVPLVILARTGSEQIIRDALETGVSEYIIRDPVGFYLAKLPVRLLNIVQAYRSGLSKKESVKNIVETPPEVRKISATGSFETDLTSGDSTWSEGLFHLFGLDPGASNPDIEERITEITHPDDLELILATYRRAIEGIPPETVEFRTVLPDGSVRNLICNTRLVCDESGKPVKITGTLQDITEIKNMELEQAATVRFLEMSIDSNSVEELINKAVNFFRDQFACDAVGIRLRLGEDYPYYQTSGFPAEFVRLENNLCSYDSKGEIIRDSEGNPVLECMCGNVICGRFDPSLEFFSQNGSFWSNGTTALLANTTDEDRQARTRNRCNGEGYESVALIPLRAGHMNFGLLQINAKREGIFTARSIEHAERLSDQLSIVLSKRLADEEIRTKNLELAEALRHNSEISAMIAHDLKNPVTPIAGYAELLLGGSYGDIPESMVKPLNVILSSSNILDSLISDFAMLASLERGQLEIRTEPVSLSDQIDLTVSHFDSLDHQKPFSIRTEVEDVTLTVDPSRLQQILSNIINNSIKYSKETIDVVIRSELLDSNIMIHISDNGIGISEDVIPHIFESFYRVLTEDTTTVKGSGLGLAIVKRLLGLMDGTVTATSTPGEGSTFTITLPVTGRS